MHVHDLKAIWIWQEFKSISIFNGEIDDHKDSTAHKLIEKNDDDGFTS